MYVPFEALDRWSEVNGGSRHNSFVARYNGDGKGVNTYDYTFGDWFPFGDSLRDANRDRDAKYRARMAKLDRALAGTEFGASALQFVVNAKRFESWHKITRRGSTLTCTCGWEHTSNLSSGYVQEHELPRERESIHIRFQHQQASTRNATPATVNPCLTAAERAALHVA